jgi:N-acetylneuraminate synthase
MGNFVINTMSIEESAHIFIIAEACDNHMGNIDTAKEMIRLAKLSGCDCIKFQHHLPDEEMLCDVPMSSNFDIPLYDFLKLYALTLEQHIELKNYCNETGIMYLCTPFSLKAAYELNDIGVTAFKIGSGEMTDIPTLLKIADLGKPMIISTGMCTLDEIKRTYEALLPKKTPLAFTNCLSEYPPKYEDVNLGVIAKMKELLPNAVIGHSDHTPDLYTSFAAAALGAKIIEKHVILDKKTPGPDQSVSIDFYDLRQLVDGVRKIELALGNQKIIHKNEIPIRRWAFRSVISTRKLRKGEKITEDMIWSKRPGTGIPSHRMFEIIGKTLSHDIEPNTILRWEDFVD